MKEYDVTITETLEMTVSVEAESREEAQQIASDNWKNGDYIAVRSLSIKEKIKAAREEARTEQGTRQGPEQGREGMAGHLRQKHRTLRQLLHQQPTDRP